MYQQKWPTLKNSATASTVISRYHRIIHFMKFHHKSDMYMVHGSVTYCYTKRYSRPGLCIVQSCAHGLRMMGKQNQGLVNSRNYKLTIDYIR